LRRAAPYSPVAIPTRGPSFRTTQAPTFHRRRPPRLGPRSLDPDRPFWSAYAELIRGQMPPTDFCKLRYFDVRARTTTLVPRSDDGLDHLPVLTRMRPLPCGSGSERRAVHPSSRGDPAAGSSRLRGFARLRYRRDRATTERVAPPVCSDDRRARVRGPSEGRVCPGRKWHGLKLCPCGRCVRLERSHADDVPLLGVLRTSAVAGARAHERRNSRRRRGPTEARVPPAPREGNRLSANRDAFHRHAPSAVHRVTPARGAKTISRSRHPTRFPQAGER